MATLLERELGTGGELLTSAVARSAALARAHERCRAVLAPKRVWRRPDGVVSVAFPVSPGASLAEVRASRLLSVGECVLVGVAVADALAALQAERLAHGDVSAANVLVSGRHVTLVDTMGALGHERGTPGFAAPERTIGASPEGDVFALGMLLRWLADPQAAPVVEAWTAPLVAVDPAARPSAAHAAAALARCAPAAAIRSPDSPVAAAMRAAAVEPTERNPEDRWWRVQVQAVRLAPLAALAVLAAISGVALMPAIAGSPNAAGSPSHRAIENMALPVHPAALLSPEEAAKTIAARRIEALADGNATALLALDVAGSPSASADAVIAKALAEGDAEFTGLELIGVHARVMETTPGGAIVEVTTTLSGYSVGPKSMPGGMATATLELVATQRGWLVERILPQP